MELSKIYGTFLVTLYYINIPAKIKQRLDSQYEQTEQNKRKKTCHNQLKSN